MEWIWNRMSEVDVKVEGGLSAVCGVCSSPAAAHQHYGAICCYSCRAFFRRGVGRLYNCVRGDGRCEVNKINRTNCRKCRFDTCLMVGMRPELVDATLKSRLREPTSQGIREQDSPGVPRIPDQEQRPVTIGPPGNVRTSPQVQFTTQMFASEMRQAPETSIQRMVADSVLLQALEGKRKVVLEPRNPCPTIVPTIATNKLIDLSKIAQSNKANQLGIMSANNHLLDLTNHKANPKVLVTQIQLADQEEMRESDLIFPEGSIYYAPAHLVPYQDQFQVIKEETVLAEDITEEQCSVPEQTGEESMKLEHVYYGEPIQTTENMENTENTGYKETENTGYRETDNIGYMETEKTGYRQTENTGYRETERSGYRETENTGYREEISMEVAVIRPTPYQRRVHLENKYSTVQKQHPEPKVQRYIPEFNESFQTPRFIMEGSKELIHTDRYIPENNKELFSTRRYIQEYTKEVFPSQRCLSKLTQEFVPIMNGNIKDTLRCVNIEELVDSCFEEEFKKEVGEVEKFDHTDQVEEENMITINEVENEDQYNVIEKPDHTNQVEQENIDIINEDHYEKAENIMLEKEINTTTEYMETDNILSPDKPESNPKTKPKEKSTKPKAKLLKKRRSSGSPLPFKKRRRNPELIYPVSLAVCRRSIPVMDFTLEEEFRLYDLMVRREHLHQKEFRACLDIGTPRAMKRCIRDIVDNTKVNQKIRFDEQFFDRWLGCVKDVHIKHARSTFQEFSKMSSSACTSMFSSTYPAVLACCMAYYFHGGNFTSYIEQEKFVGRWAGDTSEWILENVPDIREVRSVRMDDFSLFTSPWATTTKKEKFFEKSLKTIGSLMQEDDKLATIFMLLLMMSPKEGAETGDEQHREAKNDIRFLMYRYLKSKEGYDHDKANKTAHSIEGMIKALHKCGNIFINKRLKSIQHSDTFTEVTELI